MKILSFTGSRADFYLQKPFFNRIHSDPNINFHLIVGGNIPYETNQQTLSDICDSEYNHSIVKSSLDSSHATQISEIIPQVENIISKTSPDVAVVYADRYESFAFALASFHNDLILFHIEAGDITEGGTYDDNIRHCISKMSHLYATSTKNGLRILERLGEEPWRAIHTGLLSYETLSITKNVSPESILQDLGLSSTKPLLLCTMHPIPDDPNTTKDESLHFFRALLQVSLSKTCNIIITSPNHDQGSSLIHEIIDQFLPQMSNTVYVESLGGMRYHSLLSLAKSHSVIVAGNSSSIIKEAPFYGAHGLNVGSRQTGRECASSQVNVDAHDEVLTSTITKLINIKPDTSFNPYFRENPSYDAYAFLTRIMSTMDSRKILRKRWYCG